MSSLCGWSLSWVSWQSGDRWHGSFPCMSITGNCLPLDLLRLIVHHISVLSFFFRVSHLVSNNLIKSSVNRDGWFLCCSARALHPALSRCLLNDDVDMLWPWRGMNRPHRSHLTSLTDSDAVSCQTMSSILDPEGIWKGTVWEVGIASYTVERRGIFLKVPSHWR